MLKEEKTTTIGCKKSCVSASRDTINAGAFSTENLVRQKEQEEYDKAVQAISTITKASSSCYQKKIGSKFLWIWLEKVICLVMNYIFIQVFDNLCIMFLNASICT